MRVSDKPLSTYIYANCMIYLNLCPFSTLLPVGMLVLLYRLVCAWSCACNVGSRGMYKAQTAAQWQFSFINGKKTFGLFSFCEKGSFVCLIIRFPGNQRSKIKQFGQTIGHSKTGWSWHHQEQFICMTTSFSVVCKNITNCELLHKYPVLHYVCCKIMVLLWKITDEILLIPSHVVFEKSCCCCDIIDIVVMRYWSKVRQKLCYCCEELLQIILL